MKGISSRSIRLVDWSCTRSTPPHATSKPTLHTHTYNNATPHHTQVVFAGGSHFFMKDKPEGAAPAVWKTIEEVVVQGKPAPGGKV